jgi:hypothetical protein
MNCLLLGPETQVPARIIIPLKGLTTESVCGAQACKKPRVHLKNEIGERATDETK